MISKGALVNAGDLSDWTPLHQADQNGHQDAYDLLVKLGANEKPKNSKFTGSPATARGKTLWELLEAALKEGVWNN